MRLLVFVVNFRRICKLFSEVVVEVYTLLQYIPPLCQKLASSGLFIWAILVGVCSGKESIAATVPTSGWQAGPVWWQV